MVIGGDHRTTPARIIRDRRSLVVVAVGDLLVVTHRHDVDRTRRESAPLAELLNFSSVAL